jgi:methyl-accepting chemotaxis protein
VEAARAGEQGRGFAVVAAEVRGLALRSSQAAAEIKTLIGTSMETVRSGSELVCHAGNRMEQIVASVRQVGDVFASLSADTHEHAGSIGVVTESVRELDQITRENVAVADASRRIALSLQDSGHRLEQVLGSFRINASLTQPAAAPSFDAALEPTEPEAAAAAPQGSAVEYF